MRSLRLLVPLLAALVALVALRAALPALPPTPPARAGGELVRFATEDGVWLDGLLYQPAGAPLSPGLAALVTHGYRGSFYTPPSDSLLLQLAARGLPTLAINWREHDGNPEWALFEDSLLDVRAALAFLGQRGYERFVLHGQSLGSNKVAYYQGTTQDPRVAAVVLTGTPGSMYRTLSARAGEEWVQQANANMQALVDAGQGDVLWAMTLPGGRNPALEAFLITPRAWLARWGADTNSDSVRHAPQLAVPLLGVWGTADGVVPRAASEAVVAQAGRSPRADLAVIEGADHLFSQHGEALGQVVYSWLREVLNRE